MNRKLVYVLAASDYGPMIVSRLDYDTKRRGLGVGMCILENGDCEIREISNAGQIIEALCNVRGPGVFVIDGGANIGCHTIAWSNLMRGWGSLMAVEPQERVFYALCGNIALNNCTNVRAFKAVLSDTVGSMEIPEWDQEEAHNSGGCHMEGESDPGALPTGKATVRMMQIDALNLPRLDFLKLDIEGMEPKALRGAVETIRRCRPVIQAEDHICGTDAIKEVVGDSYLYLPSGINVICMPKDDPINDVVKFSEQQKEAA